MYFFVRFMGIVAITFGVLLMLLGFGAVIYGVVQNAALLELINNWLVSTQKIMLVDSRFYTTILGLGLFLAGMLVSGLGQLTLVFADVAANTRETNKILRGMQKLE